MKFDIHSSVQAETWVPANGDYVCIDATNKAVSPCPTAIIQNITLNYICRITRTLPSPALPLNKQENAQMPAL